MLEQYLFHAPKTLRNIKLSSEYQLKGYDNKAPAVFFGHYWLDANKPKWQSPNVCCLDYSVAKHGMLVAYRYYRDKVPGNKNFITVNSV